MRNRGGLRLWWLVGIILLACAARTYQIQLQSIWFDEGWSAFAAAQPTPGAAWEADATNPPLYYLLLHLAGQGFGGSELGLRWFSLLWGLLAVALMCRLGSALFGQRGGLGAAFLGAVSPLLWWASQEARMYTLLAALLALTALAWHQLLRHPTRGAWLALWGGELALLYTHNTGPVVALWLNAVMALAWLMRRSWRQPDWRLWLAGQAGVGLLWLPYLLTRFVQLQAANSAIVRPPALTGELLWKLWEALWAGPWALVGREPLVSAGAAAALLLVALIPWREPAARWLGLHTLLLVGGLLVGLAILGNEVHGRYLVMIAPLPLTALGGGLVRMGRRWLVLATASLLALPLAFAVHFTTTNPAYQHDDARGMVRHYAQTLTADDTVLAWSYADRYDLWYYWARLGAQARRVTLPEGGDLDAVLPLLPRSGRVALNVWYTQRADYRGMMGCLLEDGAANAPQVFSVYGMTSLLYNAPALNLPELQPADAVSSPATVTAAGQLRPSTAAQAQCLPLQIRLNRPVAVDLKAAITVRNPLGWEVARADAVFADAAQRTSAALPAGAALTAYPLLRLPYGAPPGDYPVFLRLYDEQAAPSGYELAAEGAPRRLDLPLGVWHVLPGADWDSVNRASDLPVAADTAWNDLRLLAHNLQGGVLRNGDALRLALLWQGAGALPNLELAGSGWTMTVPPAGASAGGIRLDWREVTIPANAAAGDLAVRLPDGRPLAVYTVEVLPLRLDLPAFTHEAAVRFPGVGSLIGFTAASTFDLQTDATVTLVWQAEAASERSYTVFVQLLNAEGRVIAQSDALPAAGARPTTGWRAGEYIEDVHHLRFNEVAVPGPAALIAGLYDAATGARVEIAPGEDAAVLRRGILIR